MDFADFQPFIRMLVIGVIVMCFQAAMTAFQRRRAKTHNGWRYLTPGPMMWIGLVCGIIVAGTFTLVVASGRGGAAGFWVAILMNLVTMTLAYSIIVDEVRWNDTRIEKRTLFFQRRTLTWHELSAAGYEIWGSWWVSGYDGRRIRFSDYYHGFEELIAKVAANLPTDEPPAEIEAAVQEAFVRVRS